MTEIFTAKRVEDAKKMAVENFGVSEDQIVFRILEEPKKGFLGFGKKGEAKIEAIYEPPVAAAAEAEKAEPAAPNKQPIESVAAPQKPAVPEPVVAPEKPAEVPQQETVSAASQAEEPERKLLTDEELEPNIKKAKEYVLSIYREMGVPITITTYQQENGILMDLSSESKSGTIIGRRGETLDSIQYLASVIANKGLEEYSRLTLDSSGYRAKRRKTLEQLAEKIAKNVLRSGRSTTLEPMNPYERRIIHSKIAEIEGVSSRSVGEDPYRRVVISSVNGKRERRNGSYHGSKGGRKPYRDQKKPEDFKPSSLDSFKTSFEKDYKKPKPEDDIHAGLYGKIEL